MTNSLTHERNIHREMFQTTEEWYGVAIKRAGIVLAYSAGHLTAEEYRELRAAVHAKEVQTEANYLCTSQQCSPCLAHWRTLAPPKPKKKSGFKVFSSP